MSKFEVTRAIMNRVRTTRNQQKITGVQLVDLVNASDEFGVMSPSAFRSLEAARTERSAVLTQAHVRAFADALNVPITDLATPWEFNALNPLPHKRNQWPANKLITAERVIVTDKPNDVVPSPVMTLARIAAYQKRSAYTNQDLCEVLTRKAGYSKVSARTLRLMYAEDEKALKKVTFEFVRALAIVFTTRYEPFNPQWLIHCQDQCPHCHEMFLSY